MKKLVCLLVVVCLVSTFVWAQNPTWRPSRNIDFIVTNSTGGGADIAARTLAQIIERENLLPSGVSIPVRNWTDGAGEAARAHVSAMRPGAVADHLLLKFSGDDMVNMVVNTPRRVTDLNHLALFAAEKHLFYAPGDSNLKTFQAVQDAIRAGQRVRVGGSRGTDPTILDLLRAQMGWQESQIPYVTSQSTGDAITQLLGGHLDLVISKPAAAHSFVEAGRLYPFVAFNTSRFSGNLAGAPTLSELGFRNIELPNFRTVASAPAMSANAQAYWIDIIQKACQTRQWAEFVERFQVIDDFMVRPTQHLVGIQNDVLRLIGR